jgi:hypothetical protein
MDRALYTVLVMIGLGWAGWVSLSVISHGRALARLVSEVCQAKDLGEKVEKLNRNIVRLGEKLGVEKDLER